MDGVHRRPRTHSARRTRRLGLLQTTEGHLDSSLVTPSWVHALDYRCQPLSAAHSCLRSRDVTADTPAPSRPVPDHPPSRPARAPSPAASTAGALSVSGRPTTQRRVA